MKKYEIELTYDIYFDGKLKESESFSQSYIGKNKKDAIMKAVFCTTIAQEYTNSLFGFIGKIEIKNIKAKYKNKYIEIKKLF